MGRKRKVLQEPTEVEQPMSEEQPITVQPSELSEDTVQPQTADEYKDLCMSCHLDYDLGLVD